MTEDSYQVSAMASESTWFEIYYDVGGSEQVMARGD